jgi:hypothetical protein
MVCAGKSWSVIATSPKAMSHAAIDNTAVEVRDSQGSLRGLLGVQADGTTAVNIVNGPPPPQPTVPVLTSVLGGITASWDGAFADGATLPLDWQRVEVHASATDGFTPTPETLHGTIETPQGSTVVVVTDAPVYVRLLARSTSGTPSAPSGQAGPLGPASVVADDILDGIVTTTKLAEDAVTAAKLAAGAVDTTALQDGAVLAEKLANAAVQVGKIANNAVVASNIQAGAVTAAALAAGSVTTDKLTVVGGANVLNDPSFEGVYAQTVASRFPQWAVQDTAFGNGSPSSMKITTDGTAQWRAVELALMPATVGDKLYIAVDYYASADWAGSELNMHIRWETEGGGTIATDKANTRATVPVKGAWTRLSGTYTAPASAVRARVRIETGLVTAGGTWFDNAVCRPVIAGVQIQDGAITTPKIVAGAVQAAQIDTGAVNADKIASGAVTTVKLDALAVTTDKLAVNSVTAEKIDVGAVTAAALAADAITGKTITGGTITGSYIQTATSGQRITLNEQGANKILVYDATSAIGELSDRGLLLQGTSGAIMWLDPDATYPNLRLTNAAQTNSAIINVVETNPGAADLGLNTGTFTANGVTDMTWRTFMGNDFAVIERYSAANPTSLVGGRLDLRNNYAFIGYRDDTGATQPGSVLLTPGLATTRARLTVQPNAGDASTLLFLQPGSSHTGPILRYYDPDSSAYRFVLDKAGNVNISGVMTAGNIATGTVSITPSAAHTPTSFTVSFAALAGTTFRGWATANTTVPGVRTPAGQAGVTGVSVSNVTATSVTVWVNRENTTSTNVNWMVIGS